MDVRTSGLLPYVQGLAAMDGFTKVGFRPSSEEEYAQIAADEQMRVRIRGVNLVRGMKGDYSYAVPRLTSGDYSNMVFMAGDLHSLYIRTLLRKFCRPGTREWAEFTALRTSKRAPRPDGRGDYVVVKNVEPIAPPPSEKLLVDSQSNAKMKVYTLSQLFSDSFIQAKYEISPKFRRDMQLVAMTKPEDAAATFQEYLQNKSTITVKVHSAGYARTSHRAITAIRSLAAGLPMASAAVDSIVIGRELYMEGKTKEGVWYAKGPLANAASIADVYNLAQHGGLREVIFLLGDETQALGIDIFEKDLCISPVVVGHARLSDVEMPSVSNSVTLDAMTDYAKEKMVRVAANIRPIVGEDGVVASAVRIDTRMIIFNHHVVQNAPDAIVDGATLGGTLPISSDLWMQRLDGLYEPWQIGTPKVGDKVAILYHNGDRPVLSPPIVISKVDGVMITSHRTPGIVEGMSGGAIVSLVDFSLLGIHTGMMTRVLLASAVTETVKMDLLETISLGESQKLASSTMADAVMTQLKSRGLHKGFVQTLRRLEMLKGHSGDHVGTAVRYCGKMWTTCPSGSYGSSGGLMRFSNSDGFFTTSDHPSASSAGGLPHFRKPMLHEKVCVVVSTDSGPYLSGETTVRQVTPGGKVFFVDLTEGNLFSLAGGVIVSVRDGAVLGAYCRDTTIPQMSILSMCSAFPAVKEVLPDPVALLAKAFPMLHVDRWDVGLVATACRHTSLASEGDTYSGLALRGDAMLRSMLYESLAKAGVKYGEWNGYGQTLQSNAQMSTLVADLGLEGLLRVQSGLVLGTGHKAYADMFEALCCVMSIEEEPGAVALALDTLGIVPSSRSFELGVGAAGNMMRRPSEVGLLVDTEVGESRLLTPVE